MTLRNATYIYNEFAIPRNLLRQLAEEGVVRYEERMSIDGIHLMRLYCVEDCAAYLQGGKQQ